LFLHLGIDPIIIWKFDQHKSKSHSHSSENETIHYSKFQTLIGHKCKVNCVEFSPDGNLIVSGSENGGKLWNTKTFTSIGDLEIPTAAQTSKFKGGLGVSRVEFSASQIWILGAYNEYLLLWSTETMGCVIALDTHKSLLNDCRFFGDSYLCSVSDSQLQLLNIENSEQLVYVSDYPFSSCAIYNIKNAVCVLVGDTGGKVHILQLQ